MVKPLPGGAAIVTTADPGVRLKNKSLVSKNVVSAEGKINLTGSDEKLLDISIRRTGSISEYLQQRKAIEVIHREVNIAAQPLAISLKSTKAITANVYEVSRFNRVFVQNPPKINEKTQKFSRDTHRENYLDDEHKSFVSIESDKKTKENEETSYSIDDDQIRSENSNTCLKFREIEEHSERFKTNFENIEIISETYNLDRNPNTREDAEYKDMEELEEDQSVKDETLIHSGEQSDKDSIDNWKDLDEKNIQVPDYNQNETINFRDDTLFENEKSNEKLRHNENLEDNSVKSSLSMEISNYQNSSNNWSSCLEEENPIFRLKDKFSSLFSYIKTVNQSFWKLSNYDDKNLEVECKDTCSDAFEMNEQGSNYQSSCSCDPSSKSSYFSCMETEST